MAIIQRDPGDEQQWRPAEMPRRVYGDPSAVLGVRTVAYLDEHRDRLIAEEHGYTVQMEFARWLHERGRLAGAGCRDDERVDCLRNEMEP